MWPKSHCKNTKVGRLSQIFRTFVFKFGGGEVEGGRANFGNVKIYESTISEIGPSNLRESRSSRIQYFYLVLEMRWLASPFDLELKRSIVDCNTFLNICIRQSRPIGGAI